LSGVQISLVSAHILSDVFSIEWGLRKLIFKESDLDEQVILQQLVDLVVADVFIIRY
jgi:protein phosphatase 1 regulatory subunit 37